MINKKAFGEIQFIIFLAVFIVSFSIISNLFNKQILEQKQEDKNIIEKIIDEISKVGTWLGSNTLGRIPVVKDFYELSTASINIKYVEPYLGLIYLAFFGLPLGYIIIRIVRGGG